MSKEKRRYLRLSTVLPVEFSVLDNAGKRITPWLQGFTHNLSRGGICLVVNDLWWGFWDRFNFSGAELILHINIPLKKLTFSARARVIWSEEKKLERFAQYLVGLEFTQIEKKSQNELFRFALIKKFLPFGVGFVLGVFILASLILLGRTQSLIRQRRRLVKNYIERLRESSFLEEALLDKEEDFFIKRKDQLEEEIFSKEKELLRLKERGVSADGEEINLLEAEISLLRRELNFLENKERERKLLLFDLEKELKRLERERSTFSQKIIEGVYSWIKQRQDLLSGLVLSYEGDPNLAKAYFTYDQALAAIVFLLFEEKERAEKILDFYLERIKRNEPVYNAYSIRNEVWEYIVHSGPNAWLGLAVLNYTKITQNKRYLPIAEGIANFLLRMMDEEGGVRGGPQHPWYSTEHNLDALAFFNLFYEVSGEKKYLDAAKRLEGWLLRYAYTTYGPPVKRGKADSTIATDTYTFSILAIGPERLFQLNMNPEAILDFSFENCEVQTSFKHKDREVYVRGFDFAKFKNIPRGGVISCEWTAQMVLSLAVMADFYKNRDTRKFKDYLKKSLFYFNELQKLLITSPSWIGREDPCLPYASSSYVDTGHGWYTPAGDRTCSLAANAYFLIAYFGYNPFGARFLNFSLKELYAQGGDFSLTETH